MNTTKTTTTKKLNFNDLVSRYNNEGDNPTDHYANTLTELATAVTYSVLKKIILSSSNPTVEKLKNGLTNDRQTLARLDYTNDHLTDISLNSNGDLVTTVDSELSTLTADLFSHTISDGYDLVNDAIVSILEQTQKQKDREPDQPTDLERPFTIKRLKKKVWIKEFDTVGGYEAVTTTPIQEIFKAVRRCIDCQHSIKNDSIYNYIDEYTDSGERIYKRLDKYADLGGYVHDFNGSYTVYTTDEITAKTVDNLIQSLNLTTRQLQILRLRLRGYGYKAIATYLGVTVGNIRSQLVCIQQKAIKKGISPDQK